MNIVILAAGQGKRMHSDLPKVLQPVAGRPMVEHVLHAAIQAGGARVVVVVGHGAALVQERLASFGSERVQFALQAQQAGTGDALKCALSRLDPGQSQTLVLLGDVPLITPETIKVLCEKAGNGIGILTSVLDDPTGYGRIVKKSELVQRIVEQKDATDEERAIREVNSGIMVLPTARLKEWLYHLNNHNAQGEYYLTDVIEMAVKEACPVISCPVSDPDEVMGVNSKSQLAVAERAWQRREAKRLLDAGVTLADPTRIDVRGEISCGRDVFIDVGCVFEGKVELGDRVHVGPYCVIKDTSFSADNLIQAYTHADGAKVGKMAKIGPFTRLRPGAQLEDETHIGNFCEIKKSTIGRGSKVNHLSYIGDTSMGARVNIGAGTITCNYDGVNKFRTEIGNDVFVGSDTQLIAPVKVGDGATLGAGTTLAKNAPAGELTISRVRQITIPGWKRPVKSK